MSNRIKYHTQQKTEQRSQIKTLWIVMAVFITPLVLAWVFFLNGDNMDLRTTNNGQLLSPPVLLDDIKIHGDTGDTRLAEYHGKWLLMYINNDICDEVCIDNIYNMNRIRLALGKKSRQVNPVLITARDGQANPLYNIIYREYPILTRGTLDQEQFKELGKLLPTSAQNFQHGALYLVDPQGYLMMSYPQQVEPKAVLKDLKKLVKG